MLCNFTIGTCTCDIALRVKILCPEVNLWDGFIVFKKGLLDQTMKCIFVSRLDPQSRQQCNDEITRRVNSADEWPPVLIFTEGINF